MAAVGIQPMSDLTIHGKYILNLLAISTKAAKNRKKMKRIIDSGDFLNKIRYEATQ